MHRRWPIALLALELGACAARAPRLSAEPATLDGMHRVESQSPGVLLLNPDFDSLRHRAGAGGPLHLRSCRVAFEDPFQAERLPGLGDRLSDYLCDAVRRELTRSGRTLASEPPRAGESLIDVWLINVRVVAPEPGGWSLRAQPAHHMAFAMRVSIQGAERDYLRFYRATAADGLFEGPDFRPDWSGMSSSVDGLVHSAWLAFERIYREAAGPEPE
jgi:hypothetical protein